MNKRKAFVGWLVDVVLIVGGGWDAGVYYCKHISLFNNSSWCELPDVIKFHR